MAAHKKQDRRGHLRRYGSAAALAAAAVVTVAVLNQTSGATVHRVAGSSATDLRPASSGADPNSAAAVQALIASVSITPADHATAITPDSVVTVATTEGTLSSVSVTAGTPGGAPLAGVTAPDSRSWRSGAGLASGATYQVAVAVTDTAGTKATVNQSFQTVALGATVAPTITPSDGSTVGVGQPIVIKFARPIPAPAQATLLSHLAVAESQPVSGGWHWFSDQELHLRPQAFWPSGEKITLTADLDGWNLGDGTWGAGTTVVHVAIGDSHVSVANLQTEVMTVSDNGQVVATYPLSAGSPRYPTQDGIHIALDKEPVVHMVSGTVGIPTDGPGGYDELVYNDVHISDSGEYVHAAPWSTYAQGRENVSHGCINLSFANSKSFYDFSSVGDVIEVINGTRGPVTSDHGVMDWTLDWSQWTPATVTQA